MLCGTELAVKLSDGRTPFISRLHSGLRSSSKLSHVVDSRLEFLIGYWVENSVSYLNGVPP